MKLPNHIWIVSAVLVVAFPASPGKRSFSPEDMRKVVRTAYLCGKIDGSLQGIAEAKRVATFDDQAAVKAIMELRRKANCEDVDSLVGDLRTKP